MCIPYLHTILLWKWISICTCILFLLFFYIYFIMHYQNCWLFSSYLFLFHLDAYKSFPSECVSVDLGSEISTAYSFVDTDLKPRWSAVCLSWPSSYNLKSGTQYILPVLPGMFVTKVQSGCLSYLLWLCWSCHPVWWTECYPFHNNH